MKNLNRFSVLVLITKQQVYVGDFLYQKWLILEEIFWNYLNISQGPVFETQCSLFISWLAVCVYFLLYVFVRGLSRKDRIRNDLWSGTLYARPRSLTPSLCFTANTIAIVVRHR